MTWLPNYQRDWLRADLIAGLTVWAVMIPQAMAYAGIAGVSPLIGLYTVPFPLFLYAFLGTSRLMVVGPDSATALISGVTVSALAASGSQDYLVLTSAMAVIVGFCFLLFGSLKMGWVADFIPTPVMKAFVQGLVWVTIVGQIPKLLGLHPISGGFLQKLIQILEQLPDLHPLTALIGVLSLVLLFVLKTFVPQIPSALTTVILSSLGVTIFHLGEKGLDLIGAVETGLPHFTLPLVSLTQLNALLPGALAIVLLGYAESLGAAKTAAEKTGEEIDPNQELISLGPANIAAGLSSGFLVVGSLSKTSVAVRAGGKTQLSSLVLGVLVLLTLLFLLPLFQNLSDATLAAIVIEAMLGLVNLSYFKQLSYINKNEFAIALLAFTGVLVFGVLQGISLGVITSIVFLIYRASHPHTDVLGCIPQTEMYRDINLHPEAITTPGLLIFRFSNNLIFANSSYFRTELKKKIREASTPTQMVLIDAETINLIDSTALEMLHKLRLELMKNNIVLAWARLRDPLYQRMYRAGLTKEIGEHNFYERITDGVSEFMRPSS
ncbi:SulP family inorganic anion transporter [Planktothrix agardhii]|uniref:SulP family inorganic anion transporter n=1 Tax=Planktothrix agardhii TaxID=1160 RepID=UPI00040E3F8B